MRVTTLLTILTLAAGCGGRDTPQPSTMGGMSMRADSLMPIVRAHLDSLTSMSPQVAAGALSAHDAMASELLDAMGSDMRMMSMQADSA